MPNARTEEEMTPLRARLESWCRNVLWKHKLFRA
jgi:hypothetical protein